MKEFEKILSSRRDFLTKAVPACAVSCLAATTSISGPDNLAELKALLA